MRIDKRILFWERDFSRTVLRLALPIMLQSLVMALMHIVDNVMVGGLGDLPLAAVTQANRVSFLFQLTVFGLIGGVSTFTSQFWGKGDARSIHKVQLLATVLALAAALLFALPSWFAPGRVLSLFSADQRVVDAGIDYLRIVAVGYVITGVSAVFSTVQKSTGQVNLSMCAGICAILLNTFLNWVLIFGNLGMPAMGVRGAAIATVTGGVAELLIVLVFGHKMRLVSAIPLRDVRLPSRSFILQYLKVAMPIVLNEGLWALGTALYSAVYGRMDDSVSVIAAMGIFGNVQQIGMIVLRGLSHACAVVVGMSIGAGREDEAQYNATRLTVGCAVYGQLSAALVLLVGALIPLIYPSATPETLSRVETLVYIYCATLFINAINNILIVSVMRSGGDVAFAMVIDVGGVWVIGLPIVAVCALVLRLPIEAVYALSMFEQVVKAALGVWRLRSRRWIHNVTVSG